MLSAERKKINKMSDNNNRNSRNDRNYQNRPQNRRQEPPPAASGGLSSTIKGIIAIMLTLMVVIIVIMVFAKSLFVNDNKEPDKTGKLTVTEYIPPETTTEETAEKTSKKSSKKTESKNDDEDDEDDDPNEDYQTISCTSAVYLHPEPTSSSANLLTIPAGAECKFYRNENGWYYVEYNGTEGYAWNTFFTTPAEE